ncbi:MAG TPA: DMT family transporter [Thermoanaerobaculia bacterium]|jgi:drug/metabolite transporter (DMT)-like permease|nr:DMT family transporter [Thermoanaerobaculia bacterium]
MATPQSRRNLGAILWMLAAVAVLSLMDAAMKWLAPHYPALQVAAMRGMASLPVVVIWLALRGELRQVVRVRWALQLARAAMSVLMLTCFIYAVRTLPLADAYSIFFVSPLLITALSVPLLGERVDARRWAAIGCGLLGVLVVLRPSGAGTLTLAGVAALAAAVCYSLSAITVRVLGRTDSTGSMMFWFTSIVGFGAGALAAPRWVALRPEHWPVIAVVAVTGAFGQYAITEAFRRGEASVVAPFEYTAIAMGITLDWRLWSTRPQARMLGGATIVIAAGLYLVHRERSRPRLEAEHP